MKVASGKDLREYIRNNQTIRSFFESKDIDLDYLLDKALADIEIREMTSEEELERRRNRGPLAFYNSRKKVILISPTISGTNVDLVIIHELQHALQELAVPRSTIGVQPSWKDPRQFDALVREMEYLKNKGYTKEEAIIQVGGPKIYEFPELKALFEQAYDLAEEIEPASVIVAKSAKTEVVSPVLFYIEDKDIISYLDSIPEARKKFLHGDPKDILDVMRNIAIWTAISGRWNPIKTWILEKGEIEIDEEQISRIKNMLKVIESTGSVKHPKKIKIKPNEFYKEGLNEQQIFDYYDTIKKKIVKNLQDKPVMIVTGVDGVAYLRNDPRTGKNFSVNSIEDFEKLNNGGYLSFHTVIGKNTDVVWVDLDPKEGYKWKNVKEVAKKVRDLFLDLPWISKAEIRYTGGDGFYVIGYLKESMKTDDARKTLINLLEKEIVPEFPGTTTKVTKEPKTMRLDVSTLHDAGSIRAEWSLHEDTGLVSLNVEKINKPFEDIEKSDFTIDNVLLSVSNKEGMKQRMEKDHPLIERLKEWSEEVHIKSEEFEDIVGQTETKEPVVITYKIDGEIGILSYNGTKAEIISRKGRVRTDLPVTREIEKLLRNKKVVAIGELYVVDEKGRAVTYPKAVSTLRSPKSEEDENRIKFAVFDIREIDGKKIEDDYWKRFLLIKEIFGKGKLVHPIPAFQGDKSTIKELWEKGVSSGTYEGLVIYYNDVVKVKPKLSQDLAVIGIERSKKHPDMMGSLVLAYMDDEGNFRYAGEVGTGFKEKDRYDWLKYAESNKIREEKNIIFVKPKRVVEVQSEELNIREAPLYDKNLKEIGEEVSAIGRKPVFIRIREDKSITKQDLRLEQIPGWQEKSKSAKIKFKFDPNSTKNEGRLRLRDPEEFDQESFRRWREWAGVEAPEGISFIVGDLKDGKKALQAIRFDKTLWSEEKAGRWWESVKGKPGFEKKWIWKKAEEISPGTLIWLILRGQIEEFKDISNDFSDLIEAIDINRGELPFSEWLRLHSVEFDNSVKWLANKIEERLGTLIDLLPDLIRSEIVRRFEKEASGLRKFVSIPQWERDYWSHLLSGISDQTLDYVLKDIALRYYHPSDEYRLSDMPGYGFPGTSYSFFEWIVPDQIQRLPIQRPVFRLVSSKFGYLIIDDDIARGPYKDMDFALEKATCMLNPYGILLAEFPDKLSIMQKEGNESSLKVIADVPYIPIVEPTYGLDSFADPFRMGTGWFPYEAWHGYLDDTAVDIKGRSPMDTFKWDTSFLKDHYLPLDLMPFNIYVTPIKSILYKLDDDKMPGEPEFRRGDIVYVSNEPGWELLSFDSKTQMAKVKKGEDIKTVPAALISKYQVSYLPADRLYTESSIHKWSPGTTLNRGIVQLVDMNKVDPKSIKVKNEWKGLREFGVKFQIGKVKGKTGKSVVAVFFNRAFWSIYSASKWIEKNKNILEN